MDYFESMPSNVREKLVTAVETAVALYSFVEPEEGREGAFLCVTDLNGRIVLHQRVGRVSRETLDDTHGFKVTQYERLSLEKARRLAVRTIDGHRTSFESRWPEEWKWGGAVLADPYIVSISGLREVDDEAVAFIGCVEAELLTPAQALELAEINPKATFASYYDAYAVHVASALADRSDPRHEDYNAGPDPGRRGPDDEADPIAS